MFKKYFKKADLILLAIILVLSILGFILLRKTANANSKVEVSVGGQIVKTISLNQDGEYRIESDYGYNIILVSGGQVCVKDTDCPNKDCMDFGSISREGEVILCLPHKLAVRIVGGKGDGADAISY